jgi:GT2 family glycosyltransferase
VKLKKVLKMKPKNKLISVVMAYYNRRNHLINTLNSMTKSQYKNYEVIVVDDASNNENRIEDLQDKFKFLKVIRIEENEKQHVNPCIPMNIGFSNTSGEIIIMQNPECFHYNDVFSHVINNINNNKYLAYTTINKNISDKLSTINWSINYEKQINDIIKININDNLVKNEWYCHKNFRPMALNFCSAIMRDNLINLNGFDERYAYGIERDDIEFLDRIKRKKMDIIFVDDVIVIHQTHPPFQYSHTNTNDLRIKNHQLYARTTAKETIIRVNPDKTILK